MLCGLPGRQWWWWRRKVARNPTPIVEVTSTSPSTSPALPNPAPTLVAPPPTPTLILRPELPSTSAPPPTPAPSYPIGPKFVLAPRPTRRSTSHPVSKPPVKYTIRPATATKPKPKAKPTQPARTPDPGPPPGAFEPFIFPEEDLPRRIRRSKHPSPATYTFARRFSHTFSEPIMTQSSRLLSLPPELRNKIYHLVLTGHILRISDALGVRPPAPQLLLTAALPKNPFGLIFTCRQIYYEARLLPYAHNTFSFRSLALSLSPFLDSRTSHQVRTITSIELVTYLGRGMWGSHEPFGPGLKEEMTALVRLPALRDLKVVVDLNEGLFVRWGTRGLDFKAVREHQDALEEAVERVREDVVVRFWWA